MWLFVPEVKGLSLEEVDELYRANIKPWNSVGWKPAARRSRKVGKRRVVNGEIVDDFDDSSEKLDEDDAERREKPSIQDEKHIEKA